VNPNEEQDRQNIKENQRIRTKICSVSNKPLVEPIVACELGNLFNKEDILTELINKTLNSNFNHIRGLKDLKTLIFHHTSSSSSSTSDSASSTSNNNTDNCKYSCPVTGDAFNGIVPFIFIWSSGYVLSERAIRELGIESLQGEYGPFNAIDIIKINPNIDSNDYNILKSNMEIRRYERNLMNKKVKESNKRRRDSSDSNNKNIELEEGEEIIDKTENMKISGKKRDHKGGLVSIQGHELSTSAAASSSSSVQPPAKMTTAHSLVKNIVTKQIEKQNEVSGVYRGLFHKDHEADKKDRDLFMSVAGIRYTLS
jgi:hypothetical protein